MAKSKSSKAAQVEQRRRTKKKPTSTVKNNPFEIRVNKEKYSILGRKLKHDKGLPGLSRSKAIKKRKNTLLQEYKQRNKTSLFVDKRFGEYDNEMSLEEKMLQRFTMEKQKHHKKGLYNLDDDEELTHYGQSLGDLENFDDADLKLTDNEDEDNEKIEDTHFGGFLEKATRPYHERNEDNEQKSKKEIMEEVVAKSKLKKMERQQAQEEAFHLTQNLDSNWKAVYKLLPKREEASKANADDYDVLVRELLYETKAKPKGKMKTEEEIAKEELEKLKALEEERLKRMVSNEARKAKHVSADDLGESIIPTKDERFQLVYKDGKMVLPEGVDLEDETDAKDDNDHNERDSSDDDEEDDGEDDDANGDDDDDVDGNDDIDGDDDDDDDTDKDDDNENDSDDDSDKYDDVNDVGDKSSVDQTTTKSKNKESLENKVDQDKSKKAKKNEKELPYTFEAPKNFQDFMKCVEGWNYEQQLLIIDRIRKCHPPKLEASNKKKMEVLLGIILSYIDHLCDQSPVPIGFVNKLSKSIFELANDSPHHAAREIQRRLRSMFRDFWVRRQKSGGRQAVPGLKEIFLLGTISNIFPTSDLRHAITTPALIYMAAVLSKSYFQTSSDVLSGLFLANVILEFVALSKSFVPEVINYLSGVLSMATIEDEKTKCRPLFRIHMKSRHCLLLESESKSDSSPCKSRLSDVKKLQEDLRNCNEGFKLSTIRTCLHLTKNFITLYKDLPSFAEIFTPIKRCIKAIPIKYYPKEIQQQFNEVLQSLDVTIARQPLTLQSRKPIPLPLLEPQFDESYEIKPKRRSTSTDSNEREKLKYKYKKEMKGAIREIRKDSQFLAREKLKDKLTRDAERARKTKEIERQLAEQQGEINALEKMKKKKKR